MNLLPQKSDFTSCLEPTSTIQLSHRANWRLPLTKSERGLIIDTGGAWLTGHASDLSVKVPEIGSTLPVSLSGTLFFFSYIEAENDWTSRADGADYIDDLVWLGFKKVAQDIPRHKRAIEQTIRDAIGKFAPLLKGRSMGTLGVEPEPLFRRQEYPNPRE